MSASIAVRESTLSRAAALPVRAADRLRWLLLRALGPLAKPLVRDRDLRVAVAGSSLLLASLALTALAPLWLLALGPIVWGVPHVLSDVRYLWVRPGHHRSWPLWLAVGGPLVVLSITTQPVWGFAATAGALLVGRGSLSRKLALSAIVLPLLFVSVRASFATAIVFAHAHNFIGVALWWAWRRRSARLHALPIALFLGACALILAGGLDPIVRAMHGFSAEPSGTDVYAQLATLAPGVRSVMAPRLVLLFAFAQSAHYAVWVRLVPEEDRARETPRTFAASLRALRDDLGGPPLALAIAIALGLAAWAAIDLFAARIGYLRAVLFHGYLEVAAAALLFISGVRPRAAATNA